MVGSGGGASTDCPCLGTSLHPLVPAAPWTGSGGFQTLVGELQNYILLYQVLATPTHGHRGNLLRLVGREGLTADLGIFCAGLRKDRSSC